MRVGLLKIFVSLVMSVSFSMSCLAKEFDFSFDTQNSYVGRSNQNNPDATRLSWRLGLDSITMSKLLKGSAGLVFKNDEKNGQTGYETRMSWKLQNLTVQSKISKTWINQEGKLQKGTVSDTWYIIESNYELSDMPFSGINSGLSIYYGSGNREHYNTQASFSTLDETSTDVQAKFRLSHQMLNVAVGVGQFQLLNDLSGIEARKENQLTVEGHLFPESSVTLMPSFRLHYNADSTPALAGNMEKMETGLGLVYEPIQSSYRFSVKTAYENWFTPATDEEKDVLKFAAKIDWKQAGNKNDPASDWTIDYQLKDIRDNVNPNARSSDWSISLIWRMPIG